MSVKRVPGEAFNIASKVVGIGRKKKLIISVDLSTNAGMSKSGKSILIATSGGAKPVPDTDGVQINLNVIVPIVK